MQLFNFLNRSCQRRLWPPVTSIADKQLHVSESSLLLGDHFSLPAPPIAEWSLVDTWMRSGMQNSPQNGLEDTCLLCAGCELLFNHVMSHAMQGSLDLGVMELSWGILNSNVLLIDKNWSLFGNTAMSTLSGGSFQLRHGVSGGGITRRFWSESFGKETKRGEQDPSRYAAHICTQASVHFCWRNEAEIQFISGRCFWKLRFSRLPNDSVWKHLLSSTS